MAKTKVIDTRSEECIKAEKNYLAKLNHPFIVNMICSFQDKDNLYLVLDLLRGGDLRYHLSLVHSFTESQTKFFICCLLIALEYIHSKGVIHRDVKPENILCDEDGYIHLTDFGIAKVMKDNNIDTSGTPGYMAPEVLFAKTHSYPTDYFALGVIGFEFMHGVRPYRGNNRKEIQDKIIAYQVKLTDKTLKKDWSPESADFINKLLIRKPSKRLGYRGIEEIKQHPWLRDINWKEVSIKQLKSPFIPPFSDNIDKKHCEHTEKRSEETEVRYKKYIYFPGYDSLFQGYTCINSNIREALLDKITQIDTLPNLISMQKKAILSLQTKLNKNSPFYSSNQIAQVYSSRSIFKITNNVKSRTMSNSKNDKETISNNSYYNNANNNKIPIIPLSIDVIILKKQHRNHSKNNKNLSESNRTKLPSIDNKIPKGNCVNVKKQANLKLIQIKTLNFCHLITSNNTKQFKTECTTNRRQLYKNH